MLSHQELYLTAIRLFLSSAIMIIGAYFVQRIAKIKGKPSNFSESTKKVLIILSILSLITFIIIIIAIRN